MRRLLAALAVLACMVFAVSTAQAFPSLICVPGGEGKPVVTPTKGKCGVEYTSSYTISATEHEALEWERFSAKGIGGKPTITFGGVNVVIRTNNAKDSEVDGTGNLVIGKGPGSFTPQSGSDNLVIGESSSFIGYDGLVTSTEGTLENSVSGGGSIALGGEGNGAEGGGVDIGGSGSTVGSTAVNVGGELNHPTGVFAATFGGRIGTASGEEAVVVGGAGGKATSLYSAIFGGESDEASAQDAVATGGSKVKVAVAKEWQHG